ncbi:hypothetical protein N7493_000849 [Penicillium malachiteum]|uniref:Zn(2)-C6 fungal-type domain-containing protein n=1 Tax=Penicillium malachiteum TaxID=1324776 RepID=A0AAD6HXG3_9EURO|nr:hypothetical protein N7493_000849 [Penicillium malachiteum]
MKLDKTTLPLRQSCDRCHGQKLRCVRQSSSSATGVCDRCLRQGAPCVYSFSLPKGRRSTYAGSTTVQSESATSSRRPLSTIMDSTCASTPSSTPIPALELPTETSSKSASGARTPVSTISEHLNINSCPSFHHLQETGEQEPSSMVWLDKSLNFSLDGMGTSTINETDVNEAQSQLNLETFLNRSGFEDVNMSNIENIYAWPEHESVEEIQAGHHEILTNQDPVSSLPSQNHGQPPGQAFMNPIAAKDLPDYVNLESTDDFIARVSQLSASLHASYRATSDLTSKIGGIGPYSRRLPLFDEQSLRSASTWPAAPNTNINTYPLMSSEPSPLGLAMGSLVAPKTLGSILITTFSASHCLLQVLHEIKIINTTAQHNLSHSDIHDDAGSSTTTNPSNGTREVLDCQHSITVIRHLIIACYILVLKTWSALLVALQHDAELSAGSIPFPSFDNPDRERDGATPHPPILANMSLVLVVHLSSFLVDCLRNEMHRCSASKLEGSTDDSVMELESELRQLLARLRRTLHI